MRNLGECLARVLSPEMKKLFVVELRDLEADARIQLKVCGGLISSIENNGAQ